MRGADGRGGAGSRWGAAVVSRSFQRPQKRLSGGMTEPTSAALPRTLSPSLFLFSIVYGGMVVLAGVLGNKQVALGSWLAVEAGIFAFLILVALSSAVSELHGQSVANRLVLWGFVPLVLSIMLTALVLALPASPEMQPERLAAFDMILGQSPRLMAARDRCLWHLAIPERHDLQQASRTRRRGHGGDMDCDPRCDRQCAEPDRRHVAVRDDRLLRRVSDR